MLHRQAVSKMGVNFSYLIGNVSLWYLLSMGNESINGNSGIASRHIRGNSTLIVKGLTLGNYLFCLR